MQHQIGDTIRIPAHLDIFMMGVTHGVVTSINHKRGLLYVRDSLNRGVTYQSGKRAKRWPIRFADLTN